MDADRFDTLARSVPAGQSRRRAVLAALGGSLAALSLGTTTAKKKRKTKRKKTRCPMCACPPPPTAAPPPYCAGKNSCAGTDPSGCHVPGANSLCLCWARADDTTTFCGSTATRFGSSCSVCIEDETCVVLGGECSSGFACVGPCLHPR